MEQLSPQIMHRLVFTVLMQHLPDSQATAAMQLLTDALDHPQSQMRELAVVALAELPLSAGRRVESLATAVQDTSPRVRRRAIRAIGDQGGAAITTLPLLMTALKDTDRSVRRDAAGAIGRLGTSAFAAVPLMMPLLADSDVRTRVVAAVALKRVGVAAVPALLNGLNSPNEDVQSRCATLLSQIAPDDDRVVQALEKIVLQAHDDDDNAPRLDRAMLAVRTPPPTPMPMRNLSTETPTDVATPMPMGERVSHFR